MDFLLCSDCQALLWNTVLREQLVVCCLISLFISLGQNQHIMNLFVVLYFLFDIQRIQKIQGFQQALKDFWYIDVYIYIYIYIDIMKELVH